MHIEVIAIGNEVLKGGRVNSNAAFISRKLGTLGWRPARHMVLSDSRQELLEGLQEALQRSDLVICTGGLGPTLDDITRSVAAELFHSPLSANTEVKADLQRRFGAQNVSIDDQAMIPSKARALLNPIGTAPGLAFFEKGKMLLLLPGVPYEMEAIFEHKALSLINETFSRHTDRFEKTLSLCLLQENEVDPALRRVQQMCPNLEIGIYPDLGTLTISLSGPQEMVERAEALLIEEFPTHIFALKESRIEEALHAAFVERGKTLSCAESITGGLISHRLTALPGASGYFLGSLVVYANTLKHSLLSVRKNTLVTHGAVSREVALEMLSGLFNATGSDYGVAVTGIAGPSGGSVDKPVGTVWVALGEKRQEPSCICWDLQGRQRAQVMNIATTRILSALWRKMVHGRGFELRSSR